MSGPTSHGPDTENPFSNTQPASSALSAKLTTLRSTQRHFVTPEQRDRALLVRTDANNAGLVIKLTGDRFGIGRHPDNQACVDDDGISRFHARISIDKTKYWVEDLGSSNGTYINGRRITSCELNNGDTLNLGPRVAFRFSAATEHEERALKQLYEASVRDPLTGVFNRHYFSSQLTTELAYAARHAQPLSVILLDIDFFKSVNDTYGHLGGDAALIQLARGLGKSLRTEDVLARYGGEEFVILLRGITVEHAAAVADRLRQSLASQPVLHGDATFNITASFGCASLACCQADSTCDGLLEAADRRLYRAKEAGRNRVVASD
ncbi:MAG TPA: GGDEF domain-containing protein [Polyangiaceae bacterium]|nr:GGDEF domain-containing protein [Polyangiaceae bacterium]